MHKTHKIKVIGACAFIACLYCFVSFRSRELSDKTVAAKSLRNVWITFTKSGANSPLGLRFEAMLNSLVGRSLRVRLHLNIICDEDGCRAAELIINRVAAGHYPDEGGGGFSYVTHSLYDVRECAERMDDVVRCMTPHFSSAPGSYYSDALFYLSLGLHRIAPSEQTQIVLLDCDLHFESSIEGLFEEFNKFSPSNIFGLGYELSPVYRHVLYNYRMKNKNTTFGSELDFYKKYEIKNSSTNEENQKTSKVVKDLINTSDKIKGFPGFNSGVVLLNLEKIRQSDIFENLLKCDNVKNITKKYKFKGHLGDQDYFTILGYNWPELFHILDCGWNRQLCKWWRQYVDSNIFDSYFKCNSPIRIYHGNCNTPIPI